MTGPEMAAELLKTLRTRWMSPYQIAKEMEIDATTASKWAQGLAEHGLLASRPNQRFSHGAAALEYTVAPAWRSV
jgi:DNA-binding IclR family transcriptional regulator